MACCQLLASGWVDQNGFVLNYSRRRFGQKMAQRSRAMVAMRIQVAVLMPPGPAGCVPGRESAAR